MAGVVEEPAKHVSQLSIDDFGLLGEHKWPKFPKVQNSQESAKYAIPEKFIEQKKKRKSTVLDKADTKQKKPKKYIDLDKVGREPEEFIRGIKAIVENNSPSLVEDPRAAGGGSSPAKQKFYPEAKPIVIEADSESYKIQPNRWPGWSAERKMSVPNDLISFDKFPRDTTRWMFTPSYGRAGIGLFNWSFVEETLGHPTLVRVVVVRPSEFDDYTKLYANKMIVIELPEEVDGVGYARHWIIIIAIKLRLNRIWMMDDDIQWFREFVDSVKTTEHQHTRRFTSVFHKLEELFKTNPFGDDLAALGMRRWTCAIAQMADHFTHKVPTGVVYLNVELLQRHKINYARELPYAEDILLAAQCHNAGLTTVVWNKFIYLSPSGNAELPRTPKVSTDRKHAEHIETRPATADRQKQADTPKAVPSKEKTTTDRQDAEKLETSPAAEGASLKDADTLDTASSEEVSDEFWDELVQDTPETASSEEESDEFLDELVQELSESDKKDVENVEASPAAEGTNLKQADTPADSTGFSDEILETTTDIHDAEILETSTAAEGTSLKDADTLDTMPSKEETTTDREDAENVETSRAAEGARLKQADTPKPCLTDGELAEFAKGLNLNYT